MPPWSYTVKITCPDQQTAQEVHNWLSDEHIAEVLQAGAEKGELIHHEEGLIIEARYLFPSQDLFRRYLEHHAPTLRQAGIKRFGPERELIFSRSNGPLQAFIRGG